LCTQGAGCKAQARSNARCLASDCNAADGPLGAQPEGKGSFGPPLGVALLAWAASRCCVARLDGRAKTALRGCENGVNRP